MRSAMSRLGVTSWLCAVSMIVMAPATAQVGARSPEVMSLGLRGVYFVENQGQWRRDDVYFGLHSRGVDIAFCESGFEIHAQRDGEESLAGASGSSCEQLALTVRFPGSNRVVPIGAKPQAARFNYFVGGEGRGVASGVPSFGEVVYENLYDGIDLHVCGSDDGVLKYEFHCAPGAKWSDIRIAYDGIESLCVDNDGSLQIATESFGVLRDGVPVVWQEEDSPITARYVVVDANSYGFAIDGDVDGTRALVIDPDVAWMVYLGGSGNDTARGVAVDSTGSVLVTGTTSSTDFEGRNNSYHDGDQDAVLLKIGPSGELQWMTYLGGSDWEQGHATALDGDDNVLVTGETASIDFEGRNNEIHRVTDAFAVKVNTNGVLQWMTYLGGSSFDHGWGIAVDGTGDVLVGGSTSSVDFEGRNNRILGRNDAFVLKVRADGVLQWMTYLGGNTGATLGEGIAVDSAGNALLTGSTSSIDFEGRNNSFYGSADAFVVKVGPTGILEWMTYLGGIYSELGQGISIDSADNALVVGYTLSPDFEGRINSIHGSMDAFALRVGSGGMLHWMTYLGGSEWDEGEGIAVDGSGNIVVAGRTRSIDFEGRTNSRHEGTPTDAFALKVSSHGTVQHMTYLGGADDDFALGMAVDSAGRMLVTGGTASIDFEGRNNAHHGGRFDAFVVNTIVESGPLLDVDATCPGGGPFRISWQVAPVGGQIALIFGRESGSFRLPRHYPCDGVQLGLGTSGLQFVGDKRSDDKGTGVIGGTFSSAACGGYLQLVDVATCSVSNVVRIE